MDFYYYVGTIQLNSFPYAPPGWLLCDGAILNIQSYSALFSLIGAKFGGNGTTTFAVPNLQTAQNGTLRYCICAEGIYPNRP